MAIRSAAASPFCRPEEDPFLLLESTLRSIEVVLMLRRNLPLRRTWSEQQRRPMEWCNSGGSAPA